ncbi:MAG: hypothetical protein LQ343_005184 [Gyalolechia ehrenbergii]|nr:MAG: hypothetical protein LQ343_005184 [Gyalolechia ehrenbergii]
MSDQIPVRLLDGGLGTTLESPPHNAKFPADTCLWSSHFLISSPNTLGRVHKAFVDAGADVLLTGTYQASLQGFTATKKPASSKGDLNITQGHLGSTNQKNGVYSPDEAAALMRSAVPLARQAFSSRDPVPKKGTSDNVALSLGAYGATTQPSTEYSGEYRPESMQTVEGLYNWHEERLRVFKDDEATWNAIDYISFETLPVLQEVHAVKWVMAKHNRNERPKPWWISCVFPNDDLTLPDGSSAEAVVKAMLEISDIETQRPWGIGINCTDIKKLHHLILEYEAAAEKVLVRSEQWPWLVIYPDGAQGSVYNTETGEWEMDPEMKAQGPQIPWHEELTEIVTKAAERGHWTRILVGGCCKTTPDSIRALRAKLASTKSDAFYLETG